MVYFPRAANSQLATRNSGLPVITHLQGRLARMDVSGPAIEVDVAGVRYEVLVPLVLWPEIQVMAGESDLTDGLGPEIGLHIFYHATANNPVPVLVGFLRRAERDFFRKFTTVEGIGPAKAARAMNISVSTIARAIEQEDRAVLTKLPGIGTRGADKIIATLRGKVIAEAALHDGGVAQPVDAAKFEQKRVVADAVEAVSALGYPRADAKRWVEDAMAADPGLATLEAIMMAVLRGLDSR
jgi:Holliday junction DNA helicase RuvA